MPQYSKTKTASFLSLIFSDYTMALWTLLVISLLLSIFGVINEMQYYTLTALWAPPLLIIAPLLFENPKLINKLITPINFIITTTLMFIVYTIALKVELTFDLFLRNYVVTMAFALSILIVWSLTFSKLRKKCNKYYSTIITSLLLIAIYVVIGVLLNAWGIL